MPYKTKTNFQFQVFNDETEEDETGLVELSPHHEALLPGTIPVVFSK
jgi:hypothetical protein